MCTAAAGTLAANWNFADVFGEAFKMKGNSRTNAAMISD
jgi:hypothetical protein